MFMEKNKQQKDTFKLNRSRKKIFRQGKLTTKTEKRLSILTTKADREMLHCAVFHAGNLL